MAPPAGCTVDDMQRAARGEGGMAVRRRDGAGNGPTRPRRVDTTRREYGPPTSRKRRRKAPRSDAYMAMSRTPIRQPHKKRPLVIITERVVDRIVGGRYEWRDGQYKRRRVIVFDDGG